MKPVDYSPEAVTRRLKLVSELRDVCLSLKKAGRQLQQKEGPQPSAKPERAT